MVVFGALVGLSALGLWLYCLFDVITTPEEECRTLSKPLWVLFVALMFDVAAVCWLMCGRPRDRVGEASLFWAPSSGRAPSGRGHRAPPQRPIGPDDDPEFLARLDRLLHGDDG